MASVPSGEEKPRRQQHCLKHQQPKEPAGSPCSTGEKQQSNAWRNHRKHLVLGECGERFPQILEREEATFLRITSRTEEHPDGFPSAQVSRTLCLFQLLNKAGLPTVTVMRTDLAELGTKERGLRADCSPRSYSVLVCEAAGWGRGQQCPYLKLVLLFKNGFKWSVAFGREDFSCLLHPPLKSNPHLSAEVVEKRLSSTCKTWPWRALNGHLLSH